MLIPPFGFCIKLRRSFRARNDFLGDSPTNGAENENAIAFSFSAKKPLRLFVTYVESGVALASPLSAEKAPRPLKSMQKAKR